MNSIAQQAVPNGIGHRELARAQFTSASNRVNSQFWLPDSSFVSKTRFMGRDPSRKGVERQDVEGRRQGKTWFLDDSPRRFSSTWFPLIPLQRPPFPDIHVSREQHDHEHQHLEEEESRGRREEDRRPRDQEYGLNVEQNEQHRHQVELDGEALARAAQRRHAALVGGGLRGRGAPRGGEVGEDDHHHRRSGRDGEQDQEREVGLEHGVREKIHVVAKKLSRREPQVNQTEWRKSRRRRYIARLCRSSPTAGSNAWPPSTA